MTDNRVRQISTDAQNRRLHTLPMWARDRIRNAEADLAAATNAVECARLRAERDAALEAAAIFKKREAENMEREFVLEQQRDEAREHVKDYKENSALFLKQCDELQADPAAARALLSSVGITISVTKGNLGEHTEARHMLDAAVRLIDAALKGDVP